MRLPVQLQRAMAAEAEAAREARAKVMGVPIKMTSLKSSCVSTKDGDVCAFKNVVCQILNIRQLMESLNFHVYWDTLYEN